jgi:hypothetical protein
MDDYSSEREDHGDKQGAVSRGWDYTDSVLTALRSLVLRRLEAVPVRYCGSPGCAITTVIGLYLREN